VNWQAILLLCVGTLLVLMSAGIPVAFAFFTLNLALTYLLFGAEGIYQLILNVLDSVGKFVLVPIPMFVLMGEVLSRSGLAGRALAAVSLCLGAIPGRLAVLSLVGGAVFAAASGSALANTSMLARMLIPEMRKHGYSKLMSAGPVLAAGTLAMVIPPSAMAVLVGAVGGIPIGKLLVAGVIPGLIIALAAIAYVMILCSIRPDLAPAYEVELPPWRDRLYRVARDVFPIALLVFLVLGLIFAGVATPSESAALGALGAVILWFANGTLTLNELARALLATVRVTASILLILAGAASYSYLLAFTGATHGFVEAVLSLALAPLAVIAAMQIIVLLLGTALDQISILLITMPIFKPVVEALGFDLVWFGILMLINLDLANLTPPFGLTLYVLKTAAPSDFTMGEITRSALPFVVLDIGVIALVMTFPQLATWLPAQLR